MRLCVSNHILPSLYLVWVGTLIHTLGQALRRKSSSNAESSLLSSLARLAFFFFDFALAFTFALGLVLVLDFFALGLFEFYLAKFQRWEVLDLLCYNPHHCFPHRQIWWTRLRPCGDAFETANRLSVWYHQKGPLPEIHATFRLFLGLDWCCCDSRMWMRFIVWRRWRALMRTQQCVVTPKFFYKEWINRSCLIGLFLQNLLMHISLQMHSFLPSDPTSAWVDLVSLVPSVLQWLQERQQVVSILSLT